MNLLTKDLLWIFYQILRSVHFLLFQILDYKPKVLRPQRVIPWNAYTWQQHPWRQVYEGLTLVGSALK